MLTFDYPADSGCRGFVLRLGRLHISVAYRVRGGDKDEG